MFHEGNRVMDEHAKKVNMRTAQSALRTQRLKEEGIEVKVTRDPHVQRIAQELQFTEQPGKDMIAEMKERMRRDNVATLFAPQTTTTQDALFYDPLKYHLCRATAGSDKKYF